MACLKPDIYEYYLIIFLPYGEGICEDISPTSSHGCSGSSSSSSSTSRNHPLCRAVQQRVSLADHRGGLWGEETLIASYSPHQEEVCSEMDLDISALLHPPTPTSTHTIPESGGLQGKGPGEAFNRHERERNKIQENSYNIQYPSPEPGDQLKYYLCGHCRMGQSP